MASYAEWRSNGDQGVGSTRSVETDEPEAPSTLKAGTKIPEGVWEIHLDFLTFDGSIKKF